MVNMLYGQQRVSESNGVTLTNTGGKVDVKAQTYRWDWQAKNDQLSIYDSVGRRIVTGTLQPAVQVNQGRGTKPYCIAGVVDAFQAAGNTLTVRYKNVNHQSVITIVLHFDSLGIWQEPVEYRGKKGEDVVRLYYFSRTADNQPNPGLYFSWLVEPGLSCSASVGPVQPLASRIRLDAWMGRGVTGDNTRILQQWALPVHFFCGMSASSDHSHKKTGVYKYMSDAFCLGLANLPAGDLRLETRFNYASPVIDIRSDLWGQARGVGPHKLGAAFYWAFGDDYRNAISNYYNGLKLAGIIKQKQNSVAKNNLITLPEFNTWGAQVAIGKGMDRFDEAALNHIYDSLKRSGMKTSVFVVDAKWQAEYGPLQHDAKRFPNFKSFLDRVRADGNKIGLWAALFRCYNPADMGLTLKNMLRDVNGNPVTKQEGKKSFYFLDLSQPVVQEALRKQIKQFMHDYHPDVVKYDFGYELPPVSVSVPANKDWAGERMLRKFIDVAIEALRKENPDVVVMYYALSPFFINEFDVHSTDDLFMNEEEYSLEANRRLYFSSLLGQLGVPSYGSGGYSWLHMDDVWFDTIVSGTLGSLGSFNGDNTDSHLSDRDVAKFNGLTALRRKSNIFTVEPLACSQIGANGGHASSWIRYENGLPVLMALRTRQIITGYPIAADYKGGVSSTAKMVIASADDKAITQTKKLIIVPFENGTLTLQHPGKAKTAKVSTYTFRGKEAKVTSFNLRNGWFRMPLAEKLNDGRLVERIEVEFNN